MTWRPHGGPAAPSRRLAARPRLLPLEDRSVPSAAAAQLYAVGADTGNQPWVKVFDPADGSTKFTFLAYDATYKGGVRVAVGDVNGDGVQDIVTAPGPGYKPLVKVFDGDTGQELTRFLAYDPRFQGGVYVAAADVNGDGLADILTGAGDGGGPHVRVFNGAWAVPPIGNQTPPPAQPPTTQPPVTPPVTPPVVPPVVPPSTTTDPTIETTPGTTTGTTDGSTPGGTTTTPTPTPTPDPAPTPSTPIDTSTVVLTEFMAYDMRFRGGVRVAAGDVNGDGRAEIITAAGPTGGPHVEVYDYRTGLVGQWMAYSLQYTGGVYVTAGDIDGDGKAEIITGSGGKGVSQVKVYDDNFAVLRAFAADARGAQSARVGLVDLDGDGRQDLILAAGTQVTVRNPVNNAVKKTFNPFDPSVTNGLFVG